MSRIRIAKLLIIMIPTLLLGLTAQARPEYLAIFAADLYELFGRYYSNGPRNSTKYADPELDKMIDQQAVMVRDPEGRKKLVLEIQRRVMDRSGMIMPNPYASRALVWPHVKNLWLGYNSEPYRATVVWLDS